MSDMTWVNKWLKRAQQNLFLARHTLEDLHPKLLEACCYHCQQAVEKALKAYV